MPTITKTDRRDNTTRDYTGTVEELVDLFSHTLKAGAFYARVKGNVKINTKPKTAGSLVINLNNAAKNRAADRNPLYFYTLTSIL